METILYAGKRAARSRAGQGIAFFILLNLGLLCHAAALHFFSAPNHFVFGGASGLSVLLAALCPGVPVSTFMWLANGLLVAVGCVFLGWRVMGWTIFSSFALSAYVSLLEQLWPMAAPLTQDPLLELCYAILIPAVGSGIIFNIGASTGGTEILALILQKYTSLAIGPALLVSDIGIVLGAAVVFGPATGLYCILGVVARSTVVDSVLESINLRKVCTVITTNPEPVRRFILRELGRTATEQAATGVYTGERRASVMTVLTRAQAARLRNFMRQTDPEAFLTIVSTSEIIGKGFRSN